MLKSVIRQKKIEFEILKIEGIQLINLIKSSNIAKEINNMKKYYKKKVFGHILDFSKIELQECKNLVDEIENVSSERLEEFI